jgi:hypothetical protein
MDTPNTLSKESSNFQDVVERLLRATKRENVDKLLDLMQAHGYYRIGFEDHHTSPGGLVRHNLEMLLWMYEHNKENLPVDSIVIVALLHNLCYIYGFPYIRHRGSRSVLIATRQADFDLKAIEADTILLHMHREIEKERPDASYEPVLDNPLCELLRKADHYSACHEMSKEELQLALEGKREERNTSFLFAEQSYYHKSPSFGTSMQFMQAVRPAPKRIQVSVDDIIKALKKLNVELDDAKKNQLIDTLLEQKPQQNNAGFCRSFRESASNQEVDEHRAELADRCRRNRGAASLTAKYIYDETKGVFDTFLDTNEMYKWLLNEFDLHSSSDNFYKACQACRNYANRR